jgi:hypothetical protein
MIPISPLPPHIFLMKSTVINENNFSQGSNLLHRGSNLTWGSNLLHRGSNF